MIINGTKKPIGIGIVGCGVIAGIHAAAINEMAGGKMVSVFSRNPEKADQLAGDVKTVTGRIRTSTHQNIEGEDNAVAALEFRNGAIGVIEASTSFVPYNMINNPRSVVRKV